ncbi:aldehyde dehydrogenase family protein [Flammeovirga sp. MY04]|uniref:aldehyde dehydrogenase family protein n=1 Tax=Flammeovirga sp. MY04 TaxID=1191459 RepID=UPI0008060ABA|nr:aldehyde dehydrogenase family protein [Flammeovirga sp. MY04]ANQ50507.1 aldehyde dehydrogenase family protein [Flammeovirga sp. MY04]
MENAIITSDQNIQNIEDIFIHLKKNRQAIKDTTAKVRIKKLKLLEKYILDHRSDIQNAIHKDFNKNPIETDATEILSTLGLLRHARKNLKKWMKPNKVGTPLSMLGTSSKVMYEPKGACLIISPWNYPFYLAMGPLIYAIAAGNTVAIKPSEISSNTSLFIEKMIKDLFPDNEVKVVLGGVETSTKLLELKFDHIFFTGSPQVGKVIMNAASKNLSSVTLELGGKSPTVVLNDADLKDASDKITWGKFINAGQTCIAPDYCLVPKELEAEFVDQMQNTINEFYSPDGEVIELSKDFARIISNKHFIRLQHLINDAAEKGATVMMNGEMHEETRYIPPTLLTNVTDDMLIMQEEIFGPILPIKTYENVDEALEYIASKEKPLALYVFGQKKKDIQYVIHHSTAGGTSINDTVLHINNPELPFGGVNNSGIGKSHGIYGFMGFSNQRAILKNRVGMTGIKPIYPPYGDLATKLLDFIIKKF